VFIYHLYTRKITCFPHVILWAAPKIAWSEQAKTCHPLNSVNIQSSEDTQTGVVQLQLTFVFNISYIRMHSIKTSAHWYYSKICKLCHNFKGFISYFYVTILSSALLMRHEYILGFTLHVLLLLKKIKIRWLYINNSL